MADEQQIVWRTWDELAAQYPSEQANDEYNRQVAKWDEEASDVNIYRKGVPYMGWFWRETDFADLRIPIGRSGDSVGVMMSNKWGYDSRRLTPEEARHFRDLLDTVFVALRDDDWAEAMRLSECLDTWMYRLRDVGSWYIEETWEQWKARTAVQ